MRSRTVITVPQMKGYLADKVINFVRSKDTGIWIGAPGCLQDFDRLAKQFIQSRCPHQRKGLLKSAEDLWDNVQTQSARKSAEVYVKTMRKLVEIGGSTRGVAPPGHGGKKETDLKEESEHKSEENKSKERSSGGESEYFSREKSRITGLLREKMSDQKKEDLKCRLNILDSFALYLKSENRK
ncbi:hypothetical protein WDU94_009980, partial [Cyamophila willieti]